MIASANSFKPMTLKQVRQRLAQLLRNGHTSAKERRQRSQVAGIPEVAFRWVVPTRSRLDGNQPALILPGVLVSHARGLEHCGSLHLLEVRRDPRLVEERFSGRVEAEVGEP